MHSNLISLLLVCAAGTQAWNPAGGADLAEPHGRHFARANAPSRAAYPGGPEEAPGHPAPPPRQGPYNARFGPHWQHSNAAIPGSPESQVVSEGPGGSEMPSTMAATTAATSSETSTIVETRTSLVESYQSSMSPPQNTSSPARGHHHRKPHNLYGQYSPYQNTTSSATYQYSPAASVPSPASPAAGPAYPVATHDSPAASPGYTAPSLASPLASPAAPVASPLATAASLAISAASPTRRPYGPYGPYGNRPRPGNPYGSASNSSNTMPSSSLSTGAPAYAGSNGTGGNITLGSGAKMPSKIRGVNLGSLFVFEPWMADAQWTQLGCEGAKSEFDCGLKLGRENYTTAIQKHWDSFYTQSDFSQMKSLGLNSIRIPVGYWMREDIVDATSEPFPKGGFEHLVRICGWAADAGLFVIIDHHGAPGAQVANNADTGQYNPNPGFYTPNNYERSYKFLEWMASKIHSTPSMRTVGMLEILNEPMQGNVAANLTQEFYPTAISRIRAAEKALGVQGSNELTLMMMNKAWGSGDPSQYLSDKTNLAYDNHRYVKWNPGQAQTKDAYMKTSCNDDSGASDGTTTITAEWSLSAPLDGNSQSDADWDPAKNTEWYAGWFAAQARSYEKGGGWLFWSWKAFLSDPRWSYVDAVSTGLIPRNLDDVYKNNACQSY